MGKSVVKLHFYLYAIGQYVLLVMRLKALPVSLPNSYKVLIALLMAFINDDVNDPPSIFCISFLVNSIFLPPLIITLTGICVSANNANQIAY